MKAVGPLKKQETILPNYTILYLGKFGLKFTTIRHSMSVVSLATAIIGKQAVGNTSLLQTFSNNHISRI